jgi:hypothetical protein
MPISRFAFSCQPKFFFHVDFQIRFRNVGQRDSHVTTCLIVENDLTVCEPDDSAAKVPLVPDWRARLNLR